MTSRYAKALEAREAFRPFLETKEGLAKYLTVIKQRNYLVNNIETAANTFASELRTLNGDVYFWSDQICTLAYEASKTLPDAASIRITSIPSQSGFAWFEKPITEEFKSDDGIYGTVVAISWSVVHGTDQTLVIIVSWIGGLPIKYGLPAAPIATLLMYDGESLKERLEKVRTDQIQQVFGEINDETIARQELVIRLFLSMMAFLDQQLLEAASTNPDRAVRHRIKHDASRHGHTDHSNDPIKVITLRRPKRSSVYNEDEDRRHVEWACQWIVRGHWREQWYPVEKRHHTIWIHPYPKGPEDKPLKTTEKIFAVVR